MSENEELQIDTPVEDIDTTDVIETPDKGPVLESENPEKTESNQDDADSAEKEKQVNQDNQSHASRRIAERKLKIAEEKLAAIEQAQLEARQSQLQVIPEIPDPYEDDYESKMQVRDKALQEHTEFNTQQAILQQNQQNEQNAAAQQRLDNLQESAQTMIQKAAEVGITESDIAKDANTVINDYGLNYDIKNSLIESPDGGLAFKYLASSAAEVQRLNSMSPVQAGIHIATVIMPAAEKLKPKQSSAPPPSGDIKGNGANQTSPLIEGATFE